MSCYQHGTTVDCAGHSNICIEIGREIGVAPMIKDTGLRSGKRRIRGGRSQVRHVLDMSTLAATRFNPQIKSFYQRLLIDGKPKKVAMVPAMRKLHTTINTLIDKYELWQSNNSSKRESSD